MVVDAFDLHIINKKQIPTSSIIYMRTRKLIRKIVSKGRLIRTKHA
jgi:hypothetical protein